MEPMADPECGEAAGAVASSWYQTASLPQGHGVSFLCSSAARCSPSPPRRPLPPMMPPGWAVAAPSLIRSISPMALPPLPHLKYTATNENGPAVTLISSLPGREE